MTRPVDPRPADPDPRPGPRPEDEGALVDLLRGELDPDAARALEARLAVEPALQAARDRLDRTLATFRRAHTPPADAVLATRLAVRIREQVGREEAVARRASGAGRLRPRWARILAASVALHVVLLAFLTLRDRDRSGEGPGPGLRVALVPPPPGLASADRLPETGAWRAPVPVPAPTSLDDVALRVPDPLLPDETLELPPQEAPWRDFAPPVALAMLPRTDEALKRGRLEHLGLDPDGTLTRVRRGLERLAERQAADGSFAPGGGRGAVGQTALALLPFLGEGLGSRASDPRAAVVDRGLAWLRTALFAPDGHLRADTGVPTLEQGIALKALAEDYMLSFGRLVPAEADRRVRELGQLSAALAAAQHPDGSFPGDASDPQTLAWPVWGLDAAVRSGAVAPPDEVARRLGAGAFALPADDAGRAAVALAIAPDLGLEDRPAVIEGSRRLREDGAGLGDDPFVALAASTGLLRSDPTAFRAVGPGVAARIASGLLPTGLARDGDPVGATAMRLLALQVAYRTY